MATRKWSQSGYVPPDKDCPPEMLEALRRAVEAALRKGDLWHGHLPGGRFFAWFNA